MLLTDYDRKEMKKKKLVNKILLDRIFIRQLWKRVMCDIYGAYISEKI